MPGWADRAIDVMASMAFSVRAEIAEGSVARAVKATTRRRSTHHPGPLVVEKIIEKGLKLSQKLPI